MDYSLLLGIEVLKQRPKSLAQFHQMEFRSKKGTQSDLSERIK